MRSIYEHTTLRDMVGVAVVGILFLLSLHYMNIYRDAIVTAMHGYHVLGMVAYVMLLVVMILFMPVSTIPLIPIAMTLWGPFWGSLLTGSAWIVGAVIAFSLARTYRLRIAQTFPALAETARVIDRVLCRHTLMRALVLRTVTPIGIGSYLFGLGEALTLHTFMGISLIEMVVVIGFLASLSVLPPLYQQIGIMVLIALLMRGVVYLHSLVQTIRNGKQASQV